LNIQIIINIKETHNWRIAPSGTANAGITWTTPFSIANDGGVNVNEEQLKILEYELKPINPAVLIPPVTVPENTFELLTLEP